MIDISLSKKLSFTFQSAYPYPHIVIDNFIQDSLLGKSSDEMNSFEYFGFDGTTYSAEHQVNKFFTPWCENNIKDVMYAAPATYKLMTYFNSPEFISYIEELSGIKNLIPDNSFYGGAVHKLTNGCKLDIHADYTLHPINQTYRRLTMLIYMNKDWNKSWGSDLELWNTNMTKCVKKIEPIFNRMVLFNVAHNTFHGHPHPLNCPYSVNRLSYSICYFTKDKSKDYTEDYLGAYWQELPKNSK
jgi:Rps23 Pro-64 3,4-dihydroxylase Tpa1-like proline 4-hydroxylase